MPFSLVSTLLAEAGSLQVLPGCLEDREGGFLLTPPSLRLLTREEEGEGDDKVLAAGLQSLALEQESVLVTAALSVASSEAIQSPAASHVRSSEAGQSLADPQPEFEPEVGLSDEKTEMWSIEGLQHEDQSCQADSGVRSSGVKQGRGESVVRQVEPLDLEVARLASVEVVGGDPHSFILRMADSSYRRRLDQALKQV